jgi:hypothetical protein
MKKIIKLTENDLTKIIKKVISEQNLATVRAFGRDLIRGSKFNFTTIEDALKALRSSPRLIEELDSVVVLAMNTKKIENLNYLQAQVFEELKTIKKLNDGEALNQTKNYLNAYAKEKGYDNFSEIRNQAKKIEKEIPNSMKNLGSKGKSVLDTFKDYGTWIQVLNPKGNLSGWKFHVFADTFNDTAYVYDKIADIVSKWGGGLKIGGGQMFKRSIGTPGNIQYGKGVTIYLPSYVVSKEQQKNFLSELQSALSDYKKTGKISGDQMITGNIGYRYELSKPINPKEGVGIEDYRKLYQSNSEGGSYNIQGNTDLFR